MNALLQKAREVNKNGISGRSLSYRHLSEYERIQGAADAASAVRPFVPSVKQAAEDFGTTPAKVSAELDLRAKRQRTEQVKKLAEAFRCLPTHLRDAVIEAAGAGLIWDSLNRICR